MRNSWLIFDPHFNHSKIITFKQRDGVTPLRDFPTIEEMNERIIENYNKVVRPGDNVYFGGDIGRDLDEIMPRLPGRRKILPGNHDDEKLSFYAKWFKKNMSLWKYFTPQGHNIPVNIVATHAPLHKAAFYYKNAYCVHGHIHVAEELGNRYLNLACELVGYRPVHIEEAADMIMKRVKANPCSTCGDTGYTGGPSIDTMAYCNDC
jgi:calcineurin-like phosphoesterase family protein